MSFANTHHSFSVELARKYGPEKAILIHHFQHWIKFNRRKKQNFIEGRWWSYQKQEDILANFPYWTKKEVRILIDNLVKDGILLKENFNKNPFDRTLWYAFKDESLFLGIIEEDSNKDYESPNGQMEKSKRATPNVQMGTYITDTIPDTIPDKQTPPTPSKERGLVFGKFVTLSQGEFSELNETLGEKNVFNLIAEINDYLSSNGKKPYKDYAATIRNWFRRRQGTGIIVAPKMKKNIIDLLQEKFPDLINNNIMVIGPSYIEFNHGSYGEHIELKDPYVIEKIEGMLIKMKKNTHFLREFK
jgi:hypothetical protein